MSSLDAAIIDTAIIEHPDLLQLPRSIRLTHIEAIVWSKLHQTDGRIPAGALRRITDEDDPRTAAGALVEAGLWTMTSYGWAIVDFLEKQMSAERVRQKRADAKDRYDRWQASQGKPKRVGNAAANDPAPPRSEGKGGAGDELEAGLWEPTAALPQDALSQRRGLAMAIREAPTDALKKRCWVTFTKTYGHLYTPMTKGAAS